MSFLAPSTALTWMDAFALHWQTAAAGKGVGQMIKEAIKDVGDAAKGIVGDGAGEFKVGRRSPFAWYPGPIPSRR